MVGGGIGRRLLLMAVMRQRVNVTSASIPGPKMPLYLAGAGVLEVFPVLPLIANEPLGVGALSYAGALTIGITADRDAFPDVDGFGTAVRHELHALAPSSVHFASASGPPERAARALAALASTVSEARSPGHGG
jgi:hypothetical protein